MSSEWLLGALARDSRWRQVQRVTFEKVSDAEKNCSEKSIENVDQAIENLINYLEQIRDMKAAAYILKKSTSESLWNQHWKEKCKSKEMSSSKLEILKSNHKT